MRHSKHLQRRPSKWDHPTLSYAVGVGVVVVVVVDSQVVQHTGDANCCITTVAPGKILNELSAHALNVKANVCEYEIAAESEGTLVLVVSVNLDCSFLRGMGEAGVGQTSVFY